MWELLTPTLFLLGLGLASAGLLSIASKVFYVYEDPKILEVEDSLLGANCGGCGYPGCSAAASDAVAGKVGPDVCVAGGAEVAIKVAGVLGMEVEIKEPEIAYSSCSFTVADAATKFIYTGMNDCRAAILFDKGPKTCPIGCMGLGSCVQACPFGAISIRSGQLPVFDKKKCRGCGVCVETCPKDIIYLTSTSERMIGDYKIDECSTPCQRTCPTGIDIPKYINEISKGNKSEALRIIKERNPLPAIVGRICPAPCENECRRNIADEGIAINGLKRFVSDYEMKTGRRIHPYKNPDTGKHVAVIGGGAQGMSTAYYLACLGHQSTIFEATSQLGGIIRNVISKARLPEKVIEWDIAGILDAGVSAETNKTLGKDITISSLLKSGYDAVSLASGGLDGRKVMRGNVDFEAPVPGVFLLLDFFASTSQQEIVGKDVFIIGCGNATIEAARKCNESGASVTIVHPYPKEDILSRNIDVGKPESEGITFIFDTVVNKLKGESDKLTHIGLKRTDGLLEDECPADTVIVSAGRISDIVFTSVKNEATGEAVADKWKTIESFKVFPNIKSDDLFNLEENSAMNDNLAVVKSLGRGRRLARSIHLYLKGKDIDAQENIITPGDNVLNISEVSGVESCSRQIMPATNTAKGYSETDILYNSSEVEIGFDDSSARLEADRCLQCGLICYKHDNES